MTGDEEPIGGASGACAAARTRACLVVLVVALAIGALAVATGTVGSAAGGPGDGAVATDDGGADGAGTIADRHGQVGSDGALAAEADDGRSGGDLAVAALDDRHSGTLEGDVTTPPVRAGDRVLVGTDRGLTLVSDGTVEALVETGPVRDVARATEDRAVVVVEDRQFPNVLGVDLERGEVTWRDARHRTVYGPDVGLVDRQVPAFHVEPLGEGSADVAVAAGDAVLAVDAESGERLWTHEHHSNVWHLATVDDRVFASTQDGSILALDAGDGERTDATAVAEPFSGGSVGIGTVDRSVWDLAAVTVDGQERLAATTEDGRVVLFDPAEGSTVWDRSVTTFDHDALESYYRGGPRTGAPTVPGDGNYFNLELTVVDAERALLAVTVDVPQQAPGRHLRNDRQSLHLLDAASGEVEWEDETVDLDDVGHVVSDAAGDRLLLPRAPSGSSQQVEARSLDDGSTTDGVEVDAVPGPNRHSNGAGEGYVAADDGGLVVGSAAGDLVGVDRGGAVEWEVASLRGVEVAAGDFVGDGVEDYLLATRNQRDRGTQARGLLVRSGDDGEVAWSEVLDTTAFTEDGGYELLRTVHVGDRTDVLAIRQDPEPGPDQGAATLVRRSGDDGALVASHDLVHEGRGIRPVSMDLVGDVTGDGDANVLVAERGAVYVLDLGTGDVVWERTYQHRGPGTEVWQPLDGQDVRYRAVGGGDGPHHLLAVSRNEGEFATFEPDVSGGDLSYERVRGGDLPGQLVGQTGMDRLGDLTGDGYAEVVLEYRDEETRTAVIEPGSASVGATFSRRDSTTLSTVSADFAGDGSEVGLIAFESGSDADEISVFDGLEELWSERLESVHYRGATGVERPALPAAPVGDVTGDGADEVALVTSSGRGGSGVRVRVVDGATGTARDQYELDDWESGHGDPIPGLHAQHLPDVLGDGEDALGVVAPHRGAPADGVAYYVLDPADGELVLSGEGVLAAFLPLSDRLGTLGTHSGLDVVDPAAGLSLTSAVGDSPTELTWSFDEAGDYHTTVEVDGVLVAETLDDAATVRLPPGTHDVRVAATTPGGVTVYDRGTVEVEGGSSSDLLLYGATAGSLLALFGAGTVPALVRRLRGDSR